jgi:hypothetical protein
MVMAVDAQQAERHLAGMPSETELKDRMVRQIVGDLTIPTRCNSPCRSAYTMRRWRRGAVLGPQRPRRAVDRQVGRAAALSGALGGL